MLRIVNLCFYWLPVQRFSEGKGLKKPPALSLETLECLLGSPVAIFAVKERSV